MTESELPTGWAYAAIEDIADLNPKSFCVVPHAVDAMAHFIPMAAVSEDFSGVDVSERRAIREVQKGYTSCTADDVLFAKITPCMENGKGCVVPALPDHVAFGSTEFHVLRSTEAVTADWLANYLSQQVFRKEARSNMTGSAGQLRVPSSWLRSTRIPVAPLNEQVRVNAKVAELLSDLDAGQAELVVAQKKLKLYRESLLKAAVEGELTSAWRAANPAVETGAELLQRTLSERRAHWVAGQLAKGQASRRSLPTGWQDKYVLPISPDIARLPTLPDGWVWATLDQLSSIQGGIQKQPSRAPIKNAVPFLRVANVGRGELRLDDIHQIELFEGEAERFVLRAGDLLVVEGNGSQTEIGRCAIWNGAIANAVHQNHLIRVRPHGVDAEYLAAWLNSPDGMQRMAALAATTSGLYTLSVSKIARIPVPLPPYGEQVRIARVVAKQTEIAAAQQSVIDQVIAQATAQRQNILRSAFAGHLVPQDPADEPAEALLARIRTSRSVIKPPARRQRVASFSASAD